MAIKDDTSTHTTPALIRPINKTKLRVTSSVYRVWP